MNRIVDFMKANQNAIEIILAIVLVLALVLLFVVGLKYEKKDLTNSERIKKMTAITVLSAMSVVLYYFIKFPLGAIPIFSFIPGFLDIHFSAVPIYIGGFLFGPITGSIIVIIRMLVKLPASSTLGVGEFSDLLIGLVTVLISSIMYHKNKSKKTAIRAIVSIIVTWTIFSIFSNWLFVLPFYMGLYGEQAVLGMLMVVPKVTAENYMLPYLLIAVLPFNLILSSLVSYITFITYKRLSRIYNNL